MENVKVYVGVIASFDAEGHMLPRKIIWEDGTRYEINEVIGVRHAAALRAGGSAARYTVRIDGRQTYLFYENVAGMFFDLANPITGRWFVERK